MRPGLVGGGLLCFERLLCLLHQGGLLGDGLFGRGELGLGLRQAQELAGAIAF